jgi:DNA-binding transcriptional MerR regulator
VGDLRRLRRARLLVPATKDGDGTERFPIGDYARLRLLVDLLYAGVSARELRELARTRSDFRLASRTARKLDEKIEDLVVRVAVRLRRLSALREDLVRTREALHRCRSCHKLFEALSCRTCRAMPETLPRMVDAFFLPPEAANDKGV